MKSSALSFFAFAAIALSVAAQAQEATKKSEIRLPMTLAADQRTELHTRVAGYVAKVHVDIGDRVVAGQPLVTLDAPELEAEVRRRQQMVSQAQANHGVAMGSVATATARLRQAHSARDEQDALKQLRISERDRMATLVSGGAVQREMLDEANYNLLAVEAAIAKIDADVEAARADVDAAANEVEFAKSGIEVAKAELAYAVAQDQLREIKAPFSGLVTERSVDPGRLVSRGNMLGDPLLVIEKVDVLRGVLTIPASEAVLVTVGDRVTISNFGDPSDATAPGGGKLSVSRLSQSLDMKTRTMRVEVDLNNPYDEKSGRYKFLSGQYGSATVKIGSKQ